MIEQEKFSRLRFKIHKAPKDKPIDEHFPGLFKWKELEPYKRPSKLKDLSFLIFLYDPNSDLIEEFPELHDRKDAAAVEAKFERKEDGEWPASVQKLMTLQDVKFVPALLRFLKICNNETWREIVTLNKELDDMYVIRMQPVTDAADYKKRADLGKLCDDGVKRLKDLHKEFYDDNNDVKEKADEEFPISAETVFKIFKPLSNAS